MTGLGHAHNKMEPTIEQLKAMAYDRMQILEKARQELQAINNQIARLQQEKAKKPEPKKEEKPAEKKKE